METSSGALEEEAACSTFSKAYSLWESMTAALPWAYRSPYTLAFLCFDDWCTHTYTHKAMHACFQILRSFKTLDLHTQTHTHTPSPHPPPGLIHLLHLRMRPLWCHLQSHHFKASKAPRAISTKTKHTFSIPPLSFSLNGNSPAWGRENYIVYCTIRYSWVHAHWRSVGAPL